jgi:hypothetical protein
MQAVSVDRLASTWAVSVSDLEQEIVAGRLHAFWVNGHRRIALKEVERFVEAQVAQGQAQNHAQQRGGTETAEGWMIALSPGASFPHVWPDGMREEYTEAHEGSASDGTRQVRVRVGLTYRKSAGQDRRRAVVFLDQRPMVEFVGGNEYQDTLLMASVIKNKDDKHIVAPEMVPSEYREFDVRPFRQVVLGPYASHGLAVISRSDDLTAMVRHGLIRAGYKNLLV